MSKSISVVLPNYNGEDLLRKNLPSLYLSLEKHFEDFEIIIADDASVDGSVSFIQDNYPDILVIEHAINQGFSKNINAAIQRASKDLVFLLNTDVELTEDFFEKLIPYFDDPDTFGVMGMVIGNEKEEIQDAAKFPTIGNISIRANINFLPKDEHSTDKIPTLFLSGGWSVVDRLKINELGGFDEIYSPFYSEDVDLSLRAWKIGYKCYFEPGAICKHPSSSTIKKIKKSKVKIAAKRNKMLFHFIHLDGIYQYLYFIILILKVPFRLLTLDLNYFKAFIQFIRKLKMAKASKRAIIQLQQSRNSSLSLKDVKLKILNGIDESQIRKF